MAATASAARTESGSYEEFVRLHRDQFAAYLRRTLGRQADDRGGRIGVEDTLQEALLRIYREWPELAAERDDERDRRLFRCLRDAAGQALRDEHGRRGQRTRRPRVVAFDFGGLQTGGAEPPLHERELTAAVLGTMVRDLADTEDQRDARATLDRGVLIAGLRALTEREAVVLLAVDRFEWDQQQLASHLGMEFGALRQTLFGARKIFYSLVRHAVGVELDDEERGRLFAYLAGELTGAELRRARRHVRHCPRCQAFEREQRVFGRDAVGVLAPLPFVSGAGALAKRSSAKLASIGGGLGSGLFGVAGSGKALGVVVALLAIGTGVAATLAGLDDQHRHVHNPSVTASTFSMPGSQMTRIQAPTSAAPPRATRHARKPKRHPRTNTPKNDQGGTNTTNNVQPSTQSTEPQRQQTAPQSSGPTPKTTTPSDGGCEFFCG